MKPVKCVVWDLDDTVWKGILLEDGTVTVNPDAVKTIKTLDERGLLHSIASRNEFEPAKQRLQEAGLWDYFLYPRINWDTKAASVEAIATDLNIALDTFAFVDDQNFDRDEVSFSLPDVRTYTPDDIATLADRPEFNPAFITDESAKRRHMYAASAQRDAEEKAWEGPREDFLASLSLEMTISAALEQDLQRAEELTVRTNQLNTTARTYSYDELAALTQSPDHLFLVARLTDRYGDYGTIGLSVVERHHSDWHLKLLLMSCRVMSRGAGGLLLNHLIRLAHKTEARLIAEYVPNERNRMMLVTLRFAGFAPIGEADGVQLLARTDPTLPPVPPWVTVRTV